MSEENKESNVATIPEVSASETAPKDIAKAAAAKAEAAAKAISFGAVSDAETSGIVATLDSLFSSDIRVY